MDAGRRYKWRKHVVPARSRTYEALMVIVIEKGEVFTPAAIGSADLLLVRNCVEKVGAVDRNHVCLAAILQKRRR